MVLQYHKQLNNTWILMKSFDLSLIVDFMILRYTIIIYISFIEILL